jgi:Mce-associated membrane protein
VSGPQPSGRRRIAGESKPGIPQSQPSPEPSIQSRHLPKMQRLAWAKKPESDAAQAAAAPVGATVHRPSGLPAAGMVAMAVAVASLVFAAFGIAHGVSQWRAHSVSEARGAASKAAANAAQTIFTFDYNRLPQWSSTSKNLMTPRFAREFQSNVRALSQVAPTQRIQAKAVVRNAATLECGDRCRPDHATVLVFIDQAVITAQSTQPKIEGESVRMFMVKRDGTWLVNGRERL